MNQLEAFNQHRPLLFAIAYRMIGSVADAEDIVQEAWLRWQPVNEIVQYPKAFLSSLVTRLCIDYLRSARVRREQYVGTWLPEPLLTEQISHSKDYTELTEALSFAFLTLLECLSPTERAIFLLREVFDYDYEAIAKIVNKSASNCRQITCRARQHLILRRPRISPLPQRQEELIEQFCACWNQGDVHGLIAMMAEDISFWADGGGQVVALQKPLYGCLKVSRFLVAIRRSKQIPDLIPKIVQVNGQLAVVNFVNEKPQSVFNFEFSNDCIQSIFAVVNPEKLKAIQIT
jgi:RNA polymerase sigma-70 factor, ECF subfamily